MASRITVAAGVAAAAATALLVSTVRARAARRRPPPAEDVAPAVRAHAPRVESSSGCPVPPLLGTAVTGGDEGGDTALRGRIEVTAPPGSGRPPAFAALSLEAADGFRSYPGHVGADGSFVVKVPAGDFALVARSDDHRWVGVVDDLQVRRGRRSPDAVVPLARAVAVRGRVTAGGRGVPDGAVALALRRSGVDMGQAPIGDDGGFAIEGLPAGPLALEVSEMRDFRDTRAEVTAAAEGLAVEVEPRPVLRGRLGFEDGVTCPALLATLSGESTADDEAWTRVAEIDDTCAFVFERLPSGREARLAVNRDDGSSIEALVSLPEHGDPAFVCLAPPCDRGTPVRRASLIISPEGPMERLRAEVFRDGGEARECVGYPDCAIEGLPPGRPLRVLVSAPGCETRELPSVTLSPGPNQLRVSLARGRTLEGIARDRDGAPVGGASVRCGLATTMTHHLTGRFSLDCPARTAMLEVTRGEEGAWQSVPVARSARDHVWVDVDLP